MNSGHPGLDTPAAPAPLREARLIVPLFDNRGASLTDTLVKVEHRLTAVFGGCTVIRSVFGSWVDNGGKVFREPVYVFDVAVQDTHANRETLRAIAVFAAVHGRQQSVYLRLPSGDVEFVREARLAAAE